MIKRPIRRFYFRLALALGMTVEEMLDRMSSREIAEWVAYDRLEPIGEIRGDVRAAMTCQLIANANKPKGRRAFKLSDFLPFSQERKLSSSQGVDAMKEAMAAFAGRAAKAGKGPS